MTDPHPDHGLPAPRAAGDPSVCDARTMVAGREFYCMLGVAHRGRVNGKGHRFVHVTPTHPAPVATPWRCEAHGVTTTGDCPRCDDELIELTDEATRGCDCAVLCSMGPTCPGAILAGLEGAGCTRVRKGGS